MPPQSTWPCPTLPAAHGDATDAGSEPTTASIYATGTAGAQAATATAARRRES